MNAKRPKRYKKDRLDASAITPEIVAKWWKPRFGSTNPERMNNPLWEWLVRTRVDAYEARIRFGYPCPFDASRPGPGWCFDRMGQSVTALPDGGVVLIAGEHEDDYDPDFNIYNDVTVYHPDGSLEIFGYPKEIFPPTDFHTATLVRNRIVIIGNFGYPKDRKQNETQVAELDIVTWSVRLVPTSGESPGWIHNHVAEPKGDGRHIVVRAGLIDTAERDSKCPLLENPDQWILNLETWEWSRLTHENWDRYAFGAEGLRWLPLWKLKSLPFTIGYYADSTPDPDKPTPQQLVSSEKWDEFLSRFGGTNGKAQTEAAELYQEGFNPELDIYESLFRPNISHLMVPEIELEEEEEESEDCDEHGPLDFDEEDYSGPEGVFEGTRILVEGIVVRYKERGSQVVLTIEGKLPEHIVAALVSDLQNKLEVLLARPVYARRF